MEWEICVSLLVIGILLIVGAGWKWNRLSSKTYIDDEIVRLRQYYRNIAIFGLILLCVVCNFFVVEMTKNAWLIPLLAIGYFFGYFRFVLEPYYKASETDEIERLCLYLRPFKIDQQNYLISKRLHVRDKWGIPESIEKILCTEINNRIAQTFAIGDPNSALPTTMATSNIYASDSEWKETVERLAQKAHLIILRVGDTQGCLWEINHCIDKAYLTKIIFIIDELKDLDLIKESTEGLAPLDSSINTVGNHSMALFVDEQCKEWVAKSLESESDVKTCVDTYMKTHNSLRSYIDKYKKRNTVLGKSSEMNASPAIGWQMLSFFSNPVAYCMYNKWPTRWCVVLTAYAVVTCFVASVASILCLKVNFDQDGAMMTFMVGFFLSFLVAMIPWFWLAPRISWRQGMWGSRRIFAKSNRSLALWMFLYSACAIVIGLFWNQ